MKLGREGAERRAGALPIGQLDALARVTRDLLGSRPGARLGKATELDDFLTVPNAIAAEYLGSAARPVRAMLFDKDPARNWSPGWHQDRTIAVRARGEAAGYSAWPLKHGIHHVVPPIALLQRMLTLRIHLDPVGEDSAPLLIAPGSHKIGLIPEGAIARTVAACGTTACLATAGDIWVYASLVLHASERNLTTRRRRVLQLFYSADELPPPLGWLGISGGN
ncbi:phytanoyl-CoA dioxygenase family protein [Sphingosinicella sp. BN140058]|uniref:phytanoyl-CoA dioxygenase family protein n=1 Tax=Sphingosinicella sp. BN140058 TaxID=1892855 RepID=UPI0010118C3B|nr:phytanoyl-CoA dioxygenase family protein [Sphingosinicella sp. BN140058]QAY75957.1 phytanoyl-CoA dioxygenase [Sphingosinicella sp. BN140058]